MAAEECDELAGRPTPLSMDLLRNNRRPRRRQEVLLRELLAEGRAVVLDNTHPTPEERRDVIGLVREHDYRVVGYYFRSQLEESLERNAQREGKAFVPEVAIRRTLARLVPPSVDEGFDELHHVHVDGSGGFVVSDWEEGT
ncbi:MAG: AAA family ATPase [Acidobacteriota bacterium]